ncbi:MAG: GNAT family N-acetyltransferase [Haloferacaceae archaeon]
MSVVVRRATPDDLVALARVLDGALVDIDATTVERRAAAGEALRADDDGRAVGVLVRDGPLIRALAVRRDRRRQGIGAALVERAAAATDRLVADCRPGVAGFYRACGFRVVEREGRAYGVRADEGESRVRG